MNEARRRHEERKVKIEGEERGVRKEGDGRVGGEGREGC